ncbi:hypothetical protein JCM10908_002549 [Rhodotorula pacifica]|uniref:enoyl-CoA hydratase/isomerase family protein n=1 Tax=Rhodotorula pacifica TaxID=1495444 RepID=UPI0031754CC9
MTSVTFPRGRQEGLVTVTEPASGVWLLEMHNLPDNRLEPEFIRQAFLPALDYVELSWHKAAKAGTNKGGSLVITGERKVGKFFSNGLNLECLPAYPTFFGDYYYKLCSRIMTFPLTTVAAIAGHCYAGGLCLALCCDWRVCRPDRTWLCMNELHFGASLSDGMTALLQTRLTEPVVRKTLLTAHRYVATEALASGIVDEIVPEAGSEATISYAVNKAAGMAPLAASGVLRAMKQTLYAPTLAMLSRNESPTAGLPQKANAEAFKALLAAEVAAKL